MWPIEIHLPGSSPEAGANHSPSSIDHSRGSIHGSACTTHSNTAQTTLPIPRPRPRSRPPKLPARSPRSPSTSCVSSAKPTQNGRPYAANTTSSSPIIPPPPLVLHPSPSKRFLRRYHPFRRHKFRVRTRPLSPYSYNLHTSTSPSSPVT